MQALARTLDDGSRTGHADRNHSPFILGLSGALNADSATELAVRAVLEQAERAGARTELMTGDMLEAPIYAGGRVAGAANMAHMIDAIRRADGIVIGSPSYHGCVSGLLKNALDYVEELARDARPYLSGRPVVCISVAGGWQGASVTLQAMRNIVHALRGWPTPLGLSINSQQTRLPRGGAGGDDKLNAQFDIAAGELLDFIQSRPARAGI